APLRSLAPVLVPRRAVYFSFFYCYGDHRALHSFPTRRSSDLVTGMPATLRFSKMHGAGNDFVVLDLRDGSPPPPAALCRALADRSEEHTSELQSRENLVCRLLLEKKKKKKHRHRCTTDRDET